MNIEPDKYYGTKELMALVPMLQSRTYNWLLKCIQEGKLKVANTNPKNFPPRYVVKGQDAIDFLKEMGVE